jgi:hypothetical protein
MKSAHRLALAAALLGAALLAPSRGSSAAEIRVCENAGMRPPCIDLRHGVNDLAQWRISNSISSFSIGSGAWLMCTEPDFRGRCETFTRSRENLRGTPFQDRISSLRPVRAGGGGNWGGWGGEAEWQRIGIAVYTDRNYRGRSWVFSDDIRDLSRMGLSNQISSVRVFGGRWRLCRSPNFGGCIEVSGDVPNLRDIGFNDQISSIQEIGPGGGRPGGGRPGGSGGGWGGPGSGAGPGGPRDEAILYERTGFRGRSVTVTGEASNLRDLGFNDKAMSIRVRGTWQLCSDARFRGQCVSIRGDQDDLGRLGLPRTLSSLRKER